MLTIHTASGIFKFARFCIPFVLLRDGYLYFMGRFNVETKIELLVVLFNLVMNHYTYSSVFVIGSIFI